MLNFVPLTLENIHEIKPFLHNQNSGMCDYTPVGLYMWRNYFNTYYAISDDILFLRLYYYNKKVSYHFIARENQISHAVDLLRDFVDNSELNLCIVSSETVESLKKLYPGRVSFQTQSKWWDYLYPAETFLTFSGRKFNGQRNHINYFERTYPEYEFVPITKENVPLVLDFLENEYVPNSGFSKTESLENIYSAELLKNFGKIEYFGGFVRANGKILAFSVGETVGDTLFVHIEKARKDVRGAYQIISRDFARHFIDESVKYINREEDEGDDGLRISKLSYHPIRLIEKYTVQISL